MMDNQNEPPAKQHSEFPDIEAMTWRCDVCGITKLNRFIDVRPIDLSTSYSLPAGSVIYNVKYCNNVTRCIKLVELATASS